MKIITKSIPEETRHDTIVVYNRRGTHINFTLRMCLNQSIRMTKKNGGKARNSITKEMAKVGGCLIATYKEIEDILSKEQKRKPRYCTNCNEYVICGIDSNGDLFPYRHIGKRA